MKIKILDTEYEITECDIGDERLEGIDGYSDYFGKYILLYKEYLDHASDGEKAEHKKYVLKHEIIRAFWRECGVHRSPINEEWATNLLVVMFEKLLAAFKEAGAI